MVNLYNSVTGLRFAATRILNVYAHALLDQVYVEAVDVNKHCALLISWRVEVVRILLGNTSSVLSFRMPDDLANLDKDLARVLRLLESLTLS